MIFGIVAIIVLVIIGLRNKEIKIIKVREFVYKKWDKYTSTRVAIYDSERLHTKRDLNIKEKVRS